MKTNPSLNLQKFTRFDPGLVHVGFPGIDAMQLDPGPTEGWIFSSRIGPFCVSAGTCNRMLLYEGRYNPGQLHVGFIQNPEHSAVVQAHEYDDGTLAIHRGSVSMHEVFPAGMIWADICAPEKTMMEGIAYSPKQMKANPRLLTTGLRNELQPVSRLITQIIQNPDWNHRPHSLT